MQNTWIRYHRHPSIPESIAIVGSPGLRSVGKVVIDHLVHTLKPELIAELYSTHFPLIYQTKPSYASHPSLPGIGGIQLTSGEPELPKIPFYYHPTPPLILTDGYHANFAGQYEVGERVLDFFEEVQVKKIIVIAGYGLQGQDVCCAATDRHLLLELKKNYDLDIGYEGPFYGFSGIVFGLAKLRGIDAITLFGKTQPKPEDPEDPDKDAANAILDVLALMLNIGH